MGILSLENAKILKMVPKVFKMFTPKKNFKQKKMFTHKKNFS